MTEALNRQGKHNESLDVIDKSLKLNSSSPDAWFSKYQILENLNRTTESDSAFAKAKELAPEFYL
jgi:tetratricopeptide (TPR) repeat protein